MSQLKWAILSILTVLVSHSAVAEPVEFKGADLSYSHPGYQEKINRIWNFTRNEIAHLNAEQSAITPVVVMEPFDRALQSPEHTAWQKEWIINNPSIWLEWAILKGIPVSQVTQDWIRQRIDTLFPFPKGFRALHYDKTSVIQVDPDATFMAFYHNNEYGMKKDLVGYGYYVTAHELTHLALARRGIPDRLHHCIYVTSVEDQPTLMERAIDFLMAGEIAHSAVRMYGYNNEVGLAPCTADKGGLTSQEVEMARNYARELAPVYAISGYPRPNE